jgi:uncharacterized protein (TIGR00255 family)
MTGSGTFALDTPLGHFEAEARSVNNRFLKSTVRTHGPISGVTPIAEAVLRKTLTRGHVTVHVRFRPSASVAESAIDDEAFAAAAEHLKGLAQEHGLQQVSTLDVLRVPGVLSDPRASEDKDALGAAVREVVDGVVAELQQAREREGALMKAEVEDLLDRIETSTRSIAEHAGDVPAAYHARLKKRLEDLLKGSGVAPDPAQLARECAILAEKSDVREEIARLEAHIEHARALLREGGAVGRRLDFLVQELHREANTTASKTGDLELSRTVLDLKAGVERLREQVANLE